MRKYFVLSTALFLAGMVSFVATFLSLSGNAKEREALYLLEALKRIIRENRVKPVANGLLNRLRMHSEKYTDDGHRYYWFTGADTPVKAMNFHSVQPSKRSSFFGYYIVADRDSNIVDFGWHKP